MVLDWLGSGPFRGGDLLSAYLQTPSMVPCQQMLELVAVRAISAKRVFVEQALDAAAGAHLVGTAL